MNTSRLALLVGGLAVLLGVLIAIEPAFAGSIGTEQTILILIGLLAGYLTFRAVMGRRDVEFERASLPEVESKHAFDLPGATFTDRLRTAAQSRRGDARQHVRNDLSRTTVDVLTTYREYTEDEAESAVENGTWTDDPYAAAFFTRANPSRPIRARIRDAFAGRTAFDRRARHVLSELDAITEEP